MQKIYRKSLFYLLPCVVPSDEMKFTLELVAKPLWWEKSPEIKFYLLLNMIQFTLSTVLYLSINLLKESLRLIRVNFASIPMSPRFICTKCAKMPKREQRRKRSTNKYSSLLVFAFLIKRNKREWGLDWYSAITRFLFNSFFDLSQSLAICWTSKRTDSTPPHLVPTSGNFDARMKRIVFKLRIEGFRLSVTISLGIAVQTWPNWLVAFIIPKVPKPEHFQAN